MNDSLSLLNEIAQIVYDKKGFNIVALDVQGISSITDFMLFAEGNVERHVKAIHSTIRLSLKERDLLPLFVEGDDESQWIVLDYGDVIVHLYSPELRLKYGLEQLWKEGNIVDLDLKVPEQASQ